MVSDMEDSGLLRDCAHDVGVPVKGAMHRFYRILSIGAVAIGLLLECLAQASDPMPGTKKMGVRAE